MLGPSSRSILAMATALMASAGSAATAVAERFNPMRHGSFSAPQASPWAPATSKSRRTTAAAQKRASIKARNRARNKSHH